MLALTHAASLSWQLGWQVQCLPHTPVALVPAVGWGTVVLQHYKDFLTAWQLDSRMVKARAARLFKGWSWNLHSMYPFCHILLVKVSHSTSRDSKGGEIDGFHLPWGGVACVHRDEGNCGQPDEQTPELVTGRLRKHSRNEFGGRSGLAFITVGSQENLGGKGRWTCGRWKVRVKAM